MEALIGVVSGGLDSLTSAFWLDKRRADREHQMRLEEYRIRWHGDRLKAIGEFVGQANVAISALQQEGVAKKTSDGRHSELDREARSQVDTLRVVQARARLLNPSRQV